MLKFIELPGLVKKPNPIQHQIFADRLDGGEVCDNETLRRSSTVYSGQSRTIAVLVIRPVRGLARRRSNTAEKE